ncbi:MAG: hypothetical protein IJX92_05405 [Clostridia bacterium]|nr:hypothetical protein [Clostridia bacterium]
MIKTNIKLELNYSYDSVKDAICAALPIKREEIIDCHLVKRTLNLNDKGGIHYDATVAISLSPEREYGLLKMRKRVSEYPSYELNIPQSKLNTRPIVVGFGPAGLFAALILAECGAAPIVFERGLPVDERDERVKLFSTLGILDTECNVQFGEGGAGTYSDGKLKVGAMDKYKMKVLKTLVECGAPEDVLFSSTAHVGTDRLSGIVKKIRERIIYLGGEIHFSSRLTDISVKDGAVCGITVKNKENEEKYDTDALVLATGHSARDMFILLSEKGVALEARGFGIGVRLEHPREYINELVYGKGYPDLLESASYHLVTHLKGGRSVYSFCMCPGGTVVPAASCHGGIVTNGMSEFARDGENSNAAFLVSVTPSDFSSDSPLAGIELQKKIEEKAYSLTDSYKAPCQRLGDFLNDTLTGTLPTKPTYPIGTEIHRTENYLPEFITDSLRKSINDFDDWMRGFYYPDAVMTGPETRTTSPVRVLRGESLDSLNIKGLYPAGEGAGYAGGIISSARDGVIIAERILMKNRC